MRDAEGLGRSSSPGFAGGRQTNWSLSEWRPHGSQECVSLDAVLGSAEAACRTKCKKDGAERLTREDPEMRRILELPSKPLMFDPSIPPQDINLACKPGEWLFHGADSRALRRPLSITTLCLSTRDANKDFFFKQTGSAYGGRAGGGARAGHEAGR